MNTPETELILVGALHLAGEDGLLAQLRQRGYKVEPF
ncbi:TraB/GumN family protein [Methylobacter sp.]|nr:TraB/GumN family protein [Methylobacter sp.]